MPENPNMDDNSEVARGSLLDAWSSHGWTDGIQLQTLDDMDELVVHTQNSIYEFTVISPFAGEVLVRGGNFFPNLTQARLAGSSLGGSFLKLLGIYVGFKMEINDGERTIITSLVETITLKGAVRGIKGIDQI